MVGQPGEIPNDGEDDNRDDIDGAGKGSNLFELMIIWWKWSSKYDDNEHQNMIIMMITIWW